MDKAQMLLQRRSRLRVACWMESHSASVAQASQSCKSTSHRFSTDATPVLCFSMSRWSSWKDRNVWETVNKSGWKIGALHEDVQLMSCYLLHIKLPLNLLEVTGVIGDGFRQFCLDVGQPRAKAAHILIQLLHSHQCLSQLLHSIKARLK